MNANRYISYGDRDSRKPTAAIRADKPVKILTSKKDYKPIATEIFLSQHYNITNWENNFLYNIKNQIFPVTEKQAVIVEKIAKKINYKK
jgi:hypothetical protein